VRAIANVVCDAKRGHPDLRDSRADHSSGVTERKSRIEVTALTMSHSDQGSWPM
jgi:hypothetical protein